MALWFQLHLNDRIIGAFKVARRETKIPADRICTYDVDILLEGSPYDEPALQQQVILHNYDHGAYALIAKACAGWTEGER
jgi:hypothetical protein